MEFPKSSYSHMTRNDKGGKDRDIEDIMIQTRSSDPSSQDGICSLPSASPSLRCHLCSKDDWIITHSYSINLHKNPKTKYPLRGRFMIFIAVEKECTEKQNATRTGTKSTYRKCRRREWKRRLVGGRSPCQHSDQGSCGDNSGRKNVSSATSPCTGHGNHGGIPPSSAPPLPPWTLSGRWRTPPSPPYPFPASMPPLALGIWLPRLLHQCALVPPYCRTVI